MTSNDSTERQDSSSQSTNLDRRYGKIGISAVAAAVRCQSDARSSNEARACYAQESD